MIHQRKEWQTTLVFFPWEPHEHEQYEKAKRYDNVLWAHQVEGVQHATGVEQKAITNSSRKNKVAGPEQKWHSFVDVSGGEIKSDAIKNNI